ncbi:hypothetical protein FQZ97_1073170 [compost metagenome]
MPVRLPGTFRHRIRADADVVDEVLDHQPARHSLGVADDHQVFTVRVYAHPIGVQEVQQRPHRHGHQ